MCFEVFLCLRWQIFLQPRSLISRQTSQQVLKQEVSSISFTFKGESTTEKQGEVSLKVKVSITFTVPKEAQVKLSTCAHVDAHTPMHKHPCTYTHAHTPMHTHPCTHTHAHMYTHALAHTCTCIRMDACMHACTLSCFSALFGGTPVMLLEHCVAITALLVVTHFLQTLYVHALSYYPLSRSKKRRHRSRSKSASPVAASKRSPSKSPSRSPTTAGTNSN